MCCRDPPVAFRAPAHFIAVVAWASVVSMVRQTAKTRGRNSFDSFIIQKPAGTRELQAAWEGAIIRGLQRRWLVISKPRTTSSFGF